MTDTRLEIKLQEARLDTVMRYYVKGFEHPVENAEWFIDTAKGVVIFKLYVRSGIPAPQDSQP